MADEMRTLALGPVRVTILNAGDMIFDMADEMRVPESERHVAQSDVFTGPALFPTQCVHIALAGASVLVDACDYERCFAPDSPHRPAGYTPVSLVGQLAALGVRAEDITHVVITHAHFDHFSGVTVERDGAQVPAFPNARCYLGRADWEHAETQAALRDPASLESRTFGALHALGQMELVEGDVELAPGLRIVAAPGESPGHQLVRVAAGGQTLYCMGDLYHHPIEAERPEWMASWADAATLLASRDAFTAAALAEDALLTAAHIRDVGRLARTATGVRWVVAA